jgi:hypothetical protein
MASPSTYRSNAENASLGTRLDSWKEIAAYLGKVERTVKRWDVDRGLPIHRVPGGGRASVYAYTHELDEWVKLTKTQESEAALVATREDAARGQSSVTTFGAPDGSAMANSRVPQASAPRSVLRRNWLLASCGLLLAGVGGAAVYSAGIRATGQRLSQALQGLFANIHAESEPGTSIAVSDSEKRQARDLYLKGRYEWNQRTPDSLNRALDYFTQAILHDPGYAQAYVGMADTYDLLREYSTMPDSEAYARDCRGKEGRRTGRFACRSASRPGLCRMVGQMGFCGRRKGVSSRHPMCLRYKGDFPKAWRRTTRLRNSILLRIRSLPTEA